MALESKAEITLAHPASCLQKGTGSCYCFSVVLVRSYTCDLNTMSILMSLYAFPSVHRMSLGLRGKVHRKKWGMHMWCMSKVVKCRAVTELSSGSFLGFFQYPIQSLRLPLLTFHKEYPQFTDSYARLQFREAKGRPLYWSLLPLPHHPCPPCVGLSTVSDSLSLPTAGLWGSSTAPKSLDAWPFTSFKSGPTSTQVLKGRTKVLW